MSSALRRLNVKTSFFSTRKRASVPFTFFKYHREYCFGFIFTQLKLQRKSFHGTLEISSIELIQCSPFIMLCLGSIGMDCVISESYNWTILQRNYRKMTNLWSFSYNSFVKLYGKKIGSHNMTPLHPDLCYNEVCYKRTAL